MADITKEDEMLALADWFEQAAGMRPHNDVRSNYEAAASIIRAAARPSPSGLIDKEALTEQEAFSLKMIVDRFRDCQDITGHIRIHGGREMSMGLLSHETKVFLKALALLSTAGKNNA